MFTEAEQKVIAWLRKSTVASMKQLRHQFCISHMTVVRALKKFGYYASYNYNAAFYVLRDVPEFDDWGLWAYRDVRFSRYRTLPATIVAVVEKAPAGLTIPELEQRLQAKASNIVSRLVGQGRVKGERLANRHRVYYASDPEVGTLQLERRQRPKQEDATPGPSKLPSRCSSLDVIEVLRAMIQTDDDDPDRLARRLQAGGKGITAGQVRRVLEHYGVEKKRRPSR
jgi:hypothetical protein